MTDHPSTVEKMRGLTDSNLERVIRLLHEQLEVESTVGRRTTLRMYEAEAARRAAVEAAHDLAREAEA